MKRLVLLAATLGVAASAGAAEDIELKNSGEFRLRYVNRVDSTGIKDARDGDSSFLHRFKWNITARNGETLQAFLGLIHGADWGYTDGNSGSVNGIPGTPNPATYEKNGLLVYRAWGWWKASDMLSFKVGRIGLEIADGAVFSENDWEQVPVSHEGVLATWDMDYAKVGLFGIKTDEYTATDAFSVDPERNLYGLSLDFKNMPDAIKVANLHFVQTVSDETPASVAVNSQRFGLTVGGDTSNVMYKATAAFVTGKEKDRLPGPETNRDINTMMYDLMVGYMLPETMGLKISAGYHSDTGDDNNADDKTERYDGFYYDRHNYAGLMDVIRWGNLNYWNLNVSMMPTESIEAGLGFYMFNRSEANDGTTFGSNYALTLVDTDKELGSEIDLFVNKAYENGLKIGVRYGAFLPGDGLEAAGVDTTTIHEVFAQAALNF